ncbi:MAG: cation transporter, partial [Chloroflexia bacterium]|nr:cation transporter [Chloroflexia bacterium]
MPAQNDPSQEGDLRYRGEAGVAAHSDQQEKNRITLVSVVAALALAVLKLVAGLLTGSLALLSDAAHSGLDCVASVITYVTVRIAGRPADQDHPYG